ncbi:unnamed protein product [Withania somnifera]
MDKFPIAIFFLFFTFSFARTPLTQQENDITHIKLPGTLPESDATPTNQFDKETQHVQENQDHLPAPRGKEIKALPLTFVRQHPINRQFPVRSKRPSRLCQHHFHHAHNLKPTTESTHFDDLTPYGNDFDHVLPGGMHRVHEEWMSFLYHNNEDDDDDDDEEEQMMSKFIIKRSNHDKFGELKLMIDHLYYPFDDEDDEVDKISAMQHEDHHSFDNKKMKKLLHHHREEEEQEPKEENELHKEKKKTGGFVKHIRKFLDTYFD